MKLSTFIPARFEIIIFLFLTYAVAIAIAMIFRELAVSKLLIEMLRYSYPFGTAIFTFSFYTAWRTVRKNKFVNAFLPFFPLSAAWFVIYISIFKIL